MNNNILTTINNYLSKAIVFNLYLFAFGLFTSKALTSIGGGSIFIFGILQWIIIRSNLFKIFNDKILNLPILFFVCVLFLAIIEHPDAAAFNQIQKHLLLFFFFYVAVTNLSNLKQVENLLIVASISMGIALVYGVYQHYILNMQRIESFSFPLAFGCLLAIFIVFLLVYVFGGKINTNYRVSLLTGVMFLGLNLLFTQSRGSWLALIGGIFTLSWLKGRKVLLFLLIVSLISYLFLPQMYLDRFQSSFDLKKDPSNLTRIALWKGAFSMYRDHPFNGVGLGRFSEEYQTNYQQDYPVSTSCHAHNNILQFMAEAGTFGLIGFVWLMTAIIIWLYRNYQTLNNHNWRLFPLASLCGVIVFNIQGLIEFNYGDAETLRFFWFLMSLNAAILKLNKNDIPMPEQQLSPG